MKAKYFKRLRAKVQYYQVDTTNGLFGDFDWTFKGEVILALSHKNACERYSKRHYLHQTIENERSQCWAYFRVKLQDVVIHERHFIYY